MKVMQLPYLCKDNYYLIIMKLILGTDYADITVFITEK